MGVKGPLFFMSKLQEYNSVKLIKSQYYICEELLIDELNEEQNWKTEDSIECISYNILSLPKTNSVTLEEFNKIDE